MAYLASLIINTARSIHAKKGTKMSAPADFMPKWDGEDMKEVKMQSVDEMKQILLGLGTKKFDAFTNRKDLKNRRNKMLPVPNIKDEDGK